MSCQIRRVERALKTWISGLLPMIENRKHIDPTRMQQTVQEISGELYSEKEAWLLPPDSHTKEQARIFIAFVEALNNGQSFLHEGGVTNREFHAYAAMWGQVQTTIASKMPALLKSMSEVQIEYLQWLRFLGPLSPTLYRRTFFATLFPDSVQAALIVTGGDGVMLNPVVAHALPQVQDEQGKTFATKRMQAVFHILTKTENVGELNEIVANDPDLYLAALDDAILTAPTSNDSRTIIRLLGWSLTRYRGYEKTKRILMDALAHESLPRLKVEFLRCIAAVEKDANQYEAAATILLEASALRFTIGKIEADPLFMTTFQVLLDARMFEEMGQFLIRVAKWNNLVPNVLATYSVFANTSSDVIAELLDTINAIDPLSPLLAIGRSVIAHKKNPTKESLLPIERFMMGRKDIHEQSMLAIMIARMYQDLKMSSDALRIMETTPSVEKTPDATHIYKQIRADALMGIGKPDEALAAIREAIEQSPSDLSKALVLVSGANIMRDIGNPTDERDLLRQSLALHVLPTPTRLHVEARLKDC